MTRRELIELLRAAGIKNPVAVLMRMEEAYRRAQTVSEVKHGGG